MEALWIVIGIIAVAAILVIKHIINSAANKCANAIENKINEKKNEKMGDQEENLKDLYS